jgi:hypothetical protein
MSDRQQRGILAWLGVAVGLVAAVVTAAWVWLARLAGVSGDHVLFASLLALFSLVMCVRCMQAARERDARG